MDDNDNHFSNKNDNGIKQVISRNMWNFLESVKIDKQQKSGKDEYNEEIDGEKPKPKSLEERIKEKI